MAITQTSWVIVGGERERQSRRANSWGAVSLRLVVALGASTGLTAAVALPMAMQAHQARQADERATPRDPRPDVEVLGTSTLPHTSGAPDGPGSGGEPSQPAAPSSGLYLVEHDRPDAATPLEGATVHGTSTGGSADGATAAEVSPRVHIEVRLPDVVRVDVRIGDGAVTTLDSAPWAYPPSGPLDTEQLGPGEHTAVATIGFADGGVELRRATFRIPTG